MLVDFGSVANTQSSATPALRARGHARHLAAGRCHRGAWEIYAEVINLLNRKNAGADPEPRGSSFDPALDACLASSRSATSRNHLACPTLGLRVRF